MSDEIKNEIDENDDKVFDEGIIDEEEVKKVEELLKSSRSKRIKATSKTGSKPSSPKEHKGILGKFLKDPVIPITLVLIIAVLVYGIIYFTSLIFTFDSLGISYRELQTNYKSTDQYAAVFQYMECDLPDITFTENDQSEYSSKLKFFAAPIPNKFTDMNIILQGSARKTDDQLVALRFVFEIPEDKAKAESDDFITSVFMYYQMVMCAVLPDSDPQQVATLLSESASSQDFKFSGDIAYRFSKQSIDGKQFFALDFAPASDYAKLTK